MTELELAQHHVTEGRRDRCRVAGVADLKSRDRNARLAEQEPSSFRGRAGDLRGSPNGASEA